MLIWFLAANFLGAALYVIIKIKRRQGAVGAALFFLFLPGLGFIIYFLPLMVQQFLDRAGVDREAVLTHAFLIEQLPERPNMEEELNVMPVEDAIAVGRNIEKRELLLKQMKKDLKKSYKILMAAEQDEDSETAHYAAAAKMEIYRLLQQQWLDCRKEYEQEPDNPEKYHAACEALAEMLASGVFSLREQRGYRKHLCELVQGWAADREREVSPKEYEACLAALVELGSYGEAERFWQEQAAHLQSEAAYQNMLKLFYQAGEREKLENCLEELRKNRQIRLSAQGLEQLRYWTNRLSRAAES